MKMLLVGQAKDSNDIVYGASLDGKTLVEILGTSQGPITPAELVRICKENDCKITAEQYFTYASLFIRVMTAHQYVSWTRESMNGIIAMMQDEDCEGMLDEFFNSDNYPLMEDLMGVFADTDTYQIVPKD